MAAMRWMMALVPALALLPAGSAVAAPAAPPCVAWSGQVPLQQAIDENPCVEVQPGTWHLPRSLVLGPGKQLRGGDATTTVLTPVTDGSWPNTIGDGVVNDAGVIDGAPAVVTGLTLDAAGIATYGLCCRHVHADRLVIRAAFCSGVGIVGPNVVLANSTVSGNGFACPNAPPGAGIYIPKAADAPDWWSPQIIGNRIVDNYGPALDIAGAWGGRLAGNTITGNASWAAVSLGASHWTVEDNTISHPHSGQGQPYWPLCRGGPSGVRSAAIFLCQLDDAHNDVVTNNVIRNNRAAGGYGILLIGNDEAAPYLTPRNNTITGNDVHGSVHGCADDFHPGQWFDDRNTWSDCDVTYF